jgi:hypothetical protein
MLAELKSIASDKKDLRQFAMVMAVACALLALVLFLRNKEYWPWAFIVAAAFLALRYTFPILLLPIQKAWMGIAVIMGWFMSRIILSLLFFVVFTIIGGTGRIFKKEFLDIRFSKNGEQSYWKPVESSGDEDTYEKQF